MWRAPPTLDLEKPAKRRDRAEANVAGGRRGRGAVHADSSCNIRQALSAGESVKERRPSVAA